MKKSDTFIDLGEPLPLVGCSLRWLQGDKFALIEAIAICAARSLPYPEWVRAEIDKAMTSVFEAAFPGVDLTQDHPGMSDPPNPLVSD